MRQLQKAGIAVAVVISMSSALVAAQQLPAGGPAGGADGSPANDMRRGLSREDQLRNEDIETVSPVRRIERSPNRVAPDIDPMSPYRSFDGRGNNLLRTHMNSQDTPLRRLLASDYADGVSAMGGEGLANPRAISNVVAATPGPVPNSMRATDFLWQWGQFLDHDIVLTNGVDPGEFANIAIAAGDPWFDPGSTGARELAFNRSLYDIDSGTSTRLPRQQMNEISGWIDASQVYGSDPARAAALRAFDGSGRLTTSAGDLLPYNVDGLPNAGGTNERLFLGGDVRANEHVGLTAMHTLFLREHNRLAGQILDRNPGLGGEQVYQQARQIVAAQIQVITYREFLPLLLGDRALAPYRDYRPQTDARIANSFSTAAYRLGHSLLSTQLLRLDENMQVIAAGNLPLREAFFSPSAIEEEGIDSILRGLSRQICQELDPFVVDDVRNFLFGAPGSDGFDLAALNIQRGRDHGLPGYKRAREQLNLVPVSSFSDITSSPRLQQRLAQVYDTVDQVDLWVGALAEDHVAGAMVGELLQVILVAQFTALRDGDRFWYQNLLEPQLAEDIRATRLADIVRRNTDIGAELPDQVFRAAAPREPAQQQAEVRIDSRRNGSAPGS
ncbi:MAG: peroxidase [Halieaceae bacterium]|jgi:peroxidase